MISQSFLVVVFALVLASPLQVFCFSTQQSTLQQQRIVPTSTELSASSSRRGFLTTGIASGAALVAASVIGQPLPAFADVSDGNSLPQGALQFARLIRVKGDLKNVEKRVQDSASEMDNKEWDNVSQFLRQVYQTGDDMKSIAGGIYDPAKKKQALEDAESLKKISKGADVPASKKDGPGFLAAAAKMDALYEDFLVQLQDIPDEL